MKTNLHDNNVLSVSEPDVRFDDLMANVGIGMVTVVFRNGQPFATISPYKPITKERKPGGLQGEFWISDDFDETPPEMVADFENSSL